MCDNYYDESVDVWVEEPRTCRKPRRCDSCSSLIRRRRPYMMSRTFYEGEWDSAAMCFSCWWAQKKFGEEHKYFPHPGSLRDSLEECIENDGDRKTWGPLLDAMNKRKHRAYQRRMREAAQPPRSET